MVFEAGRMFTNKFRTGITQSASWVLKQKVQPEHTKDILDKPLLRMSDAAKFKIKKSVSTNENKVRFNVSIRKEVSKSNFLWDWNI